MIGNRLDNPVSFPKRRDEWHSYLDNHVENAIAIREFIKNAPRTKAMISPTEIDGLTTTPNHIPNELFELAGSWQAPTELSERKRFVNPNYEHPHHYSDALVVCDCGIPVIREQFSDNSPQPAHHQEHEDDCTRINRVETRLKLMKRRKELVERMAMMGISYRKMLPRLGYPMKSQGRIIKMTDQYGIDRDELATNARAKIARTVVVLSREYSPKTIGRVFGVDKSSISDMVRKETTADGMSLFQYRQRAIEL